MSKNSFLLKTFILFLGLFLGTALWGQEEEGPEAKELDLILGIDKVVQLTFSPSTKIQIGNESVVTYQLIPQKREITFKGIRPGKTSLIIRNTLGDIKDRYLITVTANDQSKVVQELREFLGNIEGIEIGVKGESVFVGGKIVVPTDMGLIELILNKYPDVLSFVELSPLTQTKVAEKMEAEINNAGLKNIKVRVVNRAYWLEGTVDKKDDIVLAERIAKAYLPYNVASVAERTNAVQQAGNTIIIQNFIEFQPPKGKKAQKPLDKMIKISSQFVELQKDYIKTFGFKWNPLMTGSGGSIQFGKTASGTVETKSRGTLAGTISNLFPKLASAKSAGQARILQSGVVIVKNKTQGSISKNTTQNFSLGSGEFTKAATATSGFTLKVTPEIKQKENINLKLNITVSSTVGAPPTTTNNTITNEMLVKSGHSAVVGGIVINSSRTDYDKDPPFGDEVESSVQDQGNKGLPLFSFLRSKKYTTERSQYVVFISPKITQNASEGVEKVRSKFKRRGR